MVCEVSVVVPIYNAQDTIKRCVDSLLCQTGTSIEIILVNDGSTDNSEEICNKYANEEERIRVINQLNSGPHGARLAGTMAASSDYIMYIDSDDWVEEGYVRELYSRISDNRCDCVITAAIEENHGKCTTMKNLIESGTYSEADLCNNVQRKMLCPENSIRQNLIMALWGKIFVTRNMLEIMKGIDSDVCMGEDLACTVGYLLKSSRIIVDNSISSYHYVVSTYSISYRYDDLYWDKAARLSAYLRKQYDHYLPSESGCVDRYLLYQMYYYISMTICQNDRSVRKCCYKSVKEMLSKGSLFIPEITSKASELEITFLDKVLICSAISGGKVWALICELFVIKRKLI